MTLKHSQQSPVTFNKKQMLLKAYWNELLFSRWFSLTQNPTAGTRKLFMEWMWFTITNISVFGFQRLLLFEGTQLLEEGPTIQGSLKKLQQYKGKWKFSKPEIHKCLILQKMQAFNLWWGGFLSAHSDEYPSTSASAWNHEDDLCVGG